MQVQICISRGFQRLRSDITFSVVTVVANLVMSLVLGSVFYDLPSTAASLNDRCVLIFFAVLFNTLSSTLEVRTTFITIRLLESNTNRSLLSMLNALLWKSTQDMHCITPLPKQ